MLELHAGSALPAGRRRLPLCLQARRRSAARREAAQEQLEWQRVRQQSAWAKYDMIKVVLTEAATATKVSMQAMGVGACSATAKGCSCPWSLACCVTACESCRPLARPPPVACCHALVVAQLVVLLSPRCRWSGRQLQQEAVPARLRPQCC